MTDFPQKRKTQKDTKNAPVPAGAFFLSFNSQPTASTISKSEADTSSPKIHVTRLA